MKKKVNKPKVAQEINPDLAGKVIGDAFSVSEKERGAIPFSGKSEDTRASTKNSHRVLAKLNNTSEIEIELIDVDVENVRTNLNEFDFINLKQSIKQNGLLQPIVVYLKNDGRYSLKYGNTRLRACKELGWTEIPVYVAESSSSESEVILQQLAENNDRNDLTSLNIAEAIDRLKKQLSSENKPNRQEDLASATGYSIDQVKKLSRALKIKEFPVLYRLIKEIETYGYSKSLFEKLFSEFQGFTKSAPAHFSEESDLALFFDTNESNGLERCSGVYLKHILQILTAGKEKSAPAHFYPAETLFWKLYGKYCTNEDRNALNLDDSEKKKDEKAIQATEALQKYMKTILKTVKNIKSDIDKIDSSQITMDKINFKKIKELKSGNAEFADALIGFDSIFAERNIDLGLTKEFFERSLASLDPSYVSTTIAKWTQEQAK